ncbi:phosphopentomutase [Rhodohalobacter barkolensis]|uniref:Phosphopentomutase n=1 Tax=Rhodohalobacter barkolensis TaxID=2053187 RepID=A0A2N0VLR8_9BACT|nr:phosphopentomutase [Rhodohalobacter barkolensis]PKD45109.1 phosphopentomutase [Rhodohalobacter barkolensis]
MPRFFAVVIDGLGIGAQEDAAQYGDEGTNTLAHVLKHTGAKLPNLERLGLGNIEPLSSVDEYSEPLGSYGKMRELSAGKDSTTGHWEIAGIHLDQPFPTYPEGFPEEVIQKFCENTGTDGVLANLPYSGTDVIRDYGEEHMKTGKPIVYTSADSVFQVACHVDVTPLDKLYSWCEFARQEVMVGEHGVGRVIARPFHGEVGNFERLSDDRHDYSLNPPKPNLLSLLQEKGVKTYSIGKIVDLFAEEGFDQYRRTKSNAEGISQTLSLMSAKIENSFVFVNLIDTDQKYGHRQDPDGFASALEEIDRAVPAMIQKLEEGDVLIFLGDHGNDPTDYSTDHTREFVPLIAVAGSKKPGKDLGIRETFSDVSASVLDFFEIENPLPGTSFLNGVL